MKSVRGSARCVKPYACVSEDQVRSDFGDFPPIPNGPHFYVAHPDTSDTSCSVLECRTVKHYSSSIPKTAKEHIVATYVSSPQKYKAEYKLAEKSLVSVTSTKAANSSLRFR